jgi:dTDP-4-dehydrorhamnose reductase
MRRLLVTGGTGTLGSAVVAMALDRDWDVRATWWRRKPTVSADWVHADIRDPEDVKRAIDGVDAVIHTAYRQGDDEWSTNVEGSEAVARAASSRRLVHLSSDIVFDGTRGRYTESDPPSPINEYGRAKAEAERLAVELHGAPTLVRTSLIYGGAEPGPQERLAQSATRFFVDEFRSPVQVTDLALAILEVLGLEVQGPLHIAGADDISRYDLAVLLGADPASIEGVPTTPDRCPNVTLDSSHAASLLATRVRGVYEVLSG